MDNKNFSLRLKKGDEIIDALGVDSDSTGKEAYEGNPVSELSKQKILIRKDDADRDDNLSDFESVSLKGLTAEDEVVKTYAAKLGQ